ncbi:MAG TPA: hypothetical protein VEK39_07750 [Solirubrobacterales bacterium]|nr:hypothetical protein [Solirubrobacterales bacterium]
MRQRRRIVASGLAALGALVLTTPSAADDGAADPAGGVVIAKRWRLPPTGSPGPPLHKRSFNITIRGGLCVGTQQEPEFERLRVRETDTSVTVTALVRVFPNTSDYCADVGLLWRRRVRLADPLEGRHLYDGNSDPPRLVWPKE